MFPIHRPRRLRTHPQLRRMVRETVVSTNDLIYPLFAVPGEGKETTNLPVAAYNVSGEYSIVKAAALNGWVDEQRVVLETMTSFKRSGADLILTDHAKDVARWLHKNKINAVF